VVLKASRTGGSRGVLQLQHEFDALQRVAGLAVPGAIELIADPPVLVLERAPGISLAKWARAYRPSIPIFLDIAIQLASAVARVHDANIIHRDLSPNNVIVDPETHLVYLIDFGLSRSSTPPAHQDKSPLRNDRFVGTPEVMAPEQTGRMNRGIDTRTDLYSLGATLYFTLTQHSVFEFKDLLALMHAHVARVPRPAIDLRTDAPLTISRILQKLLEKQPEDRYQTARGLLIDLRTCADQLAQTGRIDESLPLGRDEACNRLRFRPTLYGRDLEVAKLRET
jgi:serine/threonine protein kinase